MSFIQTDSAEIQSHAHYLGSSNGFKPGQPSNVSSGILKFSNNTLSYVSVDGKDVVSLKAEDIMSISRVFDSYKGSDLKVVTANHNQVLFFHLVYKAMSIKDGFSKEDVANDTFNINKWLKVFRKAGIDVQDKVKAVLLIFILVFIVVITALVLVTLHYSTNK